jgi:hypothetical protein
MLRFGRTWSSCRLRPKHRHRRRDPSQADRAHSLESCATKRYCAAGIQRRLFVFVSRSLLRSVADQTTPLEHPCHSTAQQMDQLGELLLGRRGDEVEGRCSAGAIKAVDPVNGGQVRVRIEPPTRKIPLL